MTLIFDLNGFSVWKNMDYEFTKYMIDTLQDFYPETLDKCLIVDAPWVFRACWVIIKPWLDPVTASKVVFVKTNELSSHVDVDLYTKGTDNVTYKDKEDDKNDDHNGGK